MTVPIGIWLGYLLTDCFVFIREPTEEEVMESVKALFPSEPEDSLKSMLESAHYDVNKVISSMMQQNTFANTLPTTSTTCGNSLEHSLISESSMISSVGTSLTNSASAGDSITSSARSASVGTSTGTTVDRASNKRNRTNRLGCQNEPSLISKRDAFDSSHGISYHNNVNVDTGKDIQLPTFNGSRIWTSDNNTKSDLPRTSSDHHSDNRVFNKASSHGGGGVMSIGHGAGRGLVNTSGSTSSGFDRTVLGSGGRGGEMEGTDGVPGSAGTGEPHASDGNDGMVSVGGASHQISGVVSNGDLTAEQAVTLQQKFNGTVSPG